MFRKTLSLLLCLAMLLSLLPAVSYAAEEVKDDFLQSVTQITWEDGIPTGYTPISSEAELEAIESDPSGLYILMNDIEIESFDILCSNDAPFTGVLEGNGHTISGIEISLQGNPGSTYYWGLFSTIEDARIANLRVEGSLYMGMDTYKNKGTCYIGGLAGLAEGNVNIINCVNAVTISHGPESGFSSKSYGTGGIVGGYYGSGCNAVFDSCVNLADIHSTRNVGGIIGYSKTYSGSITISNCRNHGEINCYENTSSPGGSYIGGIVGQLYYQSSDMKIYACMNTGDILARTSAGGIAGWVEQTSTCTGSVSSCANTGKVDASGSGGIVYYADAYLDIYDCINTGFIRSSESQADFGGILGKGFGTVTRCIHTGSITSSSYDAAIQCTLPCDTLEEVAQMVSDCYWLDGSADYLTRSYNGNMTKSEDGKLTAEQMKVEENFTNFDFPNVWYMDEELGHPFPTALLDASLDNKYETTYINDTILFSNDSYRYKTIMGGSGDGSLAGVLGDTYSASALDEVNGFWEKMQFVEGLANYSIPSTTDYDVLLADLIAGVTSRDIRDGHITSNTLGFFSELITLCGAELDALKVLTTESYLADMADIHSLFSEGTVELLDLTRNSVLADLPFDKFSGYLSQIGGVVNIVSAGAAGCEDIYDTFEFYVLCNAYADTLTSYSDVFVDAAEEAWKLDSEEGYDLYLSANEYAALIGDNLSGNYEALYNATGGAVAGLAFTGGFTILESVLKLKDLNPVLSVIDGIKTGITVGMPVADALTNMDKISYYGRMLELCNTFAKGMHAEILERRDTFAHSQSYADAQALNVASDLYLNLQIQACDYAIGYCTAITSSGMSNTFKLNQDDLVAILQLQCYKAELLQLQQSGNPVYIGEDGSISGFIANCPVTVVVSDSDGSILSRMETGSIETAYGYGGSFLLLGDQGEHKAGLYDPNEHTVTITGEGDGTMDLVTYGSKNGKLTHICTYEDVPISEGVTYVIRDTYLEGETRVEPTSIEYIQPDEVARIYGETRYQTSFGIADQLKQTLGVNQFQTIIVAYGKNFPDALTGSYLAAVKDAPILLTEDKKQTDVVAYIAENLAEGGIVYILGGASAVPASFESALNAKGITAKRLAGDDRYQTNLKILEEAGVSSEQEILICTGTGFADSLSASAAGLPILLVGKELKAEQKDFLAKSSGKFVIIGGTSAVSAKLESELKSLGTVERLGGATRYETSVLVAQRFVSNPSAAILAYAQNFPDGLCGGPLAYALGAPLILTDTKHPDAADAYIENISSGIVVGGPGLISDTAVRNIFDLSADTAITVK